MAARAGAAPAYESTARTRSLPNAKRPATPGGMAGRQASFGQLRALALVYKLQLQGVAHLLGRDGKANAFDAAPH